MGKYVYLFELDSVRKTDKEILEGQKALYKELVGNGNTVVMTYNQLVDSRAFFSLLEDSNYYDNFIKLFENGSIKLSQYGDTRSISQYLINALSNNRDFIFSGWPLKSTQKRLLALIKRSLIYSDLSEIKDILQGNITDSELLDLFTEVTENQDKDDVTGKNKIQTTVDKTKLKVEECKEILQNLYYLLKTVLRLSFIDSIYITPKKEANSKKKMKLNDFLSIIIDLQVPTGLKEKELWEEAIKILKEIPESNVRSDYHHELKKQFDNSENKDVKLSYFQFAEAIVDLSYNYQLEYSIRNTSKHYDVKELLSKDPKKMNSFSKDVFRRLLNSWTIGNNEDKYLLEENCNFVKYKIPELKFSYLFKKESRKDFFEYLKKRIPDFSKAVRLSNYYLKAKQKKAKRKKDIEIPVNIHRYEYDNKKQKKEYKKRINIAIIKKTFCIVLPCITIICGLELGIQKLQETTEDKIPLVVPELFTQNETLTFILKTLLFLFLTELITSLLSKIFNYITKKLGNGNVFLSLSEAVATLKELITDRIELSRIRETKHKNVINKESTEFFNEGNRIEYIIPLSLKEYIKLPPKFEYPNKKMKIKKINKNTSHNKVIKDILRLEELYGFHFGVIYQSQCSTLIVDPLINKGEYSDKTEPYYPTERIILQGKTDLH